MRRSQRPIQLPNGDSFFPSPDRSNEVCRGEHGHALDGKRCGMNHPPPGEFRVAMQLLVRVHAVPVVVLALKVPSGAAAAPLARPCRALPWHAPGTGGAGGGGRREAVAGSATPSSWSRAMSRYASLRTATMPGWMARSAANSKLNGTFIRWSQRERGRLPVRGCETEPGPFFTRCRHIRRPHRALQ
jgi:hypothetical protein